ncbi:MAG: TraR/DksA C4-type zinc finger protein [Burkholderiaceae bacterium]|nr:TraR/DksA C4-type zinc finger protein [Burkholderiaceae bacterium]
MTRLPGPAGASAGRELKRLLRERQCALHREWALHVRHDIGDDDLLPARQHVEDALVQVTQALERAERGRYGLCVCCNRPIDFQRLLVHPAAARCWPCQQAAESGGEALAGEADLAH